MITNPDHFIIIGSETRAEIDANINYLLGSRGYVPEDNPERIMALFGVANLEFGEYYQNQSAMGRIHIKAALKASSPRPTKKSSISRRDQREFGLAISSSDLLAKSRYCHDQLQIDKKGSTEIVLGQHVCQGLLRLNDRKFDFSPRDSFVSLYGESVEGEFSCLYWPGVGLLDAGSKLDETGQQAVMASFGQLISELRHT